MISTVSPKTIEVCASTAGASLGSSSLNATCRTAKKNIRNLSSSQAQQWATSSSNVEDDKIANLEFQIYA